MLILNKHMKGPYTLRGFLELDYPELLETKRYYEYTNH